MSVASTLGRWFTADEVRTDDRGWTYNLAIFRIVFLAMVALPFALHVVRWTARVMPELPPDVWVPISFYQLVPMNLLRNASLAHALAVLDLVLIVLALLGIWTRWTLGLATVVSVYVFGLIQNQGKVDHFHHVVWFMALLAAGPSGHVLSVDAIVRSIRTADRGIVERPAPPRAALWTLRYTWLLLGLLYLSAGLPKLHAALVGEWSGVESLRNLLWSKWFELYLYEPGFEQLPRVDMLPSSILQMASVGTILFELGFIALILFRPLRPALALAGLGFHLGNGLLLHIRFDSLLWAYVCLFDWVAMGRAVADHLRRAPLVVLYDGQCRVCRRAIALLRAFDVLNELELVSGSSEDPRRLRYPHITDDMLAHDLYVVEGNRRASGYDAYRWIACRLPLLWPVAALLWLPSFARIGRRWYRRIADSRACSLLSSSGRPAVSSTSLRRVFWIGTILVVLQLATSGVLFAATVARVHLPPHNVVRRILGAIDYRRPNWPFDQYPRFDGTWKAQTSLWEPRALLPDGRQQRLSARAYAVTLGHPTKCAVVASRLYREPDPARHQARSLELVRALWQNEAEQIQRTAVQVLVYHVTYDMNPSRRAVLEEHLIHVFPISLITSPDYS